MIYVVITLGLTTLALIIGVVLMSTGGKFNDRFKTKLMSLRVALQTLTVLILMVLYFMHKQ